MRCARRCRAQAQADVRDGEVNIFRTLLGPFYLLLSPNKKFRVAAREGDVAELRRFLLAGADVNAKNMVRAPRWVVQSAHTGRDGLCARSWELPRSA